jgi:outer membrane receptor protein involved in Fe transport
MSKARWLLSAGVFVFAAPAFAQPTQDTVPTQESPTEEGAVNQDRELREGDVQDDGVIVVTAQGRAQRLQDVPLAVSAIGQEQLQNSGATDIRALNQLAPSLLISSTGTEANASPRIRGIGTVGDNPGLESSVAVFVDGVYRSRAGVGLNEIGEVDRIEVLRGPQGTLFGRNASAGLIHVITRKPEFTFGGMAELSYGNYEQIRAQGAITGPISETLAFRLDAVYTRRDGFLEVVNAANGTEEDVNDRNRAFVRGQLLLQPNDALSVRLIGDYTWREESCCGAVYISTLETFDPTPGVPGDFAVRQPGAGGSPNGNRIVDVLTSLGGIFPSGSDPFARRIAITPGTTYRGETTDGGISLEIDYDLGSVDLTSITAYRDYKSESPSDTDYSNVDILRRDNDGNTFREFKTFSQELRLSGNAFGGALDWLVGGYFAKEDLTVRDNLRFGSQYGAFAACRLVATANPNAALRNPANPGCLSTAFVAPGVTARAAFGANFGGLAPLVLGGLDRLSTVNNVGDNFAEYRQESTNFALFTHNIFEVTDKIALTLGARYTSETKEFEADFNNTNAVCPVQQAAFGPFLPGGAASGAVPPTATPFLAGIVNLTCQGNSSTALNNLDLSDERDEEEFTGTAVISAEPSTQTLLYASYSHGYKAGGFNLDRSALGNPIFAPNDPRQAATGGFGTQNLQFDAEIVDAFEVGFKLTLPGFLFNVAGFYQRFSSFQLNTFNGSVFLVQNVNGCSANLGTTDSDVGPGSNATGSCAPDDVTAGVTSTGIEFEAQLSLLQDLNINAGITYSSTKYGQDLVGRDTGSPLDQALFLLPGDQLSNAPELVGTLAISFTPEIGNSGIRGLFYIDGRLTDGYNTGSDLFPEKEQESFAVVNGRVGIRGPEQRWALELWAQNLFNQDYQQVAFNSPFQGANSVAQVRAGNGGGAPNFATANQLFSSFLAEPRTYGITGRVRF